ncbi:thioesterase [Frankia sp. CN6]|uniref:Thioesterase n=2 Tax=Frankia nepalensis TaxID=1836974 RepID=A0A937RQF1_9ACTN|nr:alpha/beta fold hydrolase [Frankia nepalensis]MBL7633019.1 thioesterase [Frankia nepalensis]
MTGDPSRWIRRFQLGPGGGSRLVCFPHAGGAASFYVPFARALAGVAEVGGVQYPGRQDRRAEPPVTSIGALADQIAAVLHPLPDRPTAFFGHSMGAVVAFEVIRRLEARGGPVPFLLFASGRRAPSARPTGSVHRGDDAALVAEITSLGGTDPRVLADPELRSIILPPTRADYRAIETYQAEPGATISTPVTALVGDADRAATPVEAAGWKDHTTGAFDLRVFPGGHFYLVDRQAEVVDAVTAGLRAGITAGPA